LLQVGGQVIRFLTGHRDIRFRRLRCSRRSATGSPRGGPLRRQRWRPDAAPKKPDRSRWDDRKAATMLLLICAPIRIQCNGKHMTRRGIRTSMPQIVGTAVPTSAVSGSSAVTSFAGTHPHSSVAPAEGHPAAAA
jgi:hypothetical protein